MKNNWLFGLVLFCFFSGTAVRAEDDFSAQDFDTFLDNTSASMGLKSGFDEALSDLELIAESDDLWKGTEALENKVFALLSKARSHGKKHGDLYRQRLASIHQTAYDAWTPGPTKLKVAQGIEELMNDAAKDSAAALPPVVPVEAAPAPKPVAVVEKKVAAPKKEAAPRVIGQRIASSVKPKRARSDDSTAPATSDSSNAPTRAISPAVSGGQVPVSLLREAAE